MRRMGTIRGEGGEILLVQKLMCSTSGVESVVHSVGTPAPNLSEGVEAQTRRGGAKPIEIGGPEPSYLYTCTLQRRELKRTMSES